MTTVGFIYPGHAAEDDYPLAEKLLGGDIRLLVEHIYGVDLHAIAELLDLGSEANLADGAARLRAAGPQAVVWACTSGSFVYGWDGATEQVARLAEAAGAPASSTSFAFVNACRALGAKRVAVAASYPDDVAQRFADFLGTGGVEVLRIASHGIETAAEVGHLPTDAVTDLAAANDHPDADALLVPDTAMRTFGLVPELERRLGKPVLTANQVTIWEGLGLAGHGATWQDAGALFRTPAPAETAPQPGDSS